MPTAEPKAEGTDRRLWPLAEGQVGQAKAKAQVYINLRAKVIARVGELD